MLFSPGARCVSLTSLPLNAVLSHQHDVSNFYASTVSMDAFPIMHHATAPLPTRLPTEIIEEVIDQLASAIENEDPPSLRHLSLLCKSLSTRARFHLFTSIIIRSVQQMESSSEFLDLHPWVPPLVQKVSLSVDVSLYYSKPHIPLLDIVRLHLFTRLPNAHVWSMGTDRPRGLMARLSLHQSTLLCYRTYGSRIRNLELSQIRMQGVSHFARLISAFTGLQSLTCSNVWLPEKNETSQNSSEIIPNFKLCKPLAIRRLSVSMSVDVRLVEYLLGSGSNPAILDSLAVTLCEPAPGALDGTKSYSERMEESLTRLSELSSFTVVIPNDIWWQSKDQSPSLASPIQQAARILQHIRTSSRPKAVQAQINMETLATLGHFLSTGARMPEACIALEESLLAFPTAHLQICCLRPYWRRAGRSEFWSPTIASAFPKLNERGLLRLPCTRPSDPSGHEGSVSCLVAFHDSKRFATASQDGTIIVWDTELGNIELQWLAHRGPVHALGVSPDSRCLVSAGGFRGESLVIWDISNGVSKVAILASIDRYKLWETSVVACVWSLDGTLITSGCGDGTIHVWDALTFQRRGLPINNQPGPTYGQLKSLQLSPNSRYLAWRCVEFGVSEDENHFDEWTIWNPLGGEPPKRIPSHPTRSADFSVYDQVRFDPKSRYAAIPFKNRSNGVGLNDWLTTEDEFGDWSSGSDTHLGYLQVRDVLSGALVADLEHARRVADFSFTPDGSSLLSISRDGWVKVWDADSWHETASFKIDGLGSSEERARFSPNGEYVAAAALTNDNTSTFALRLWRLGEASQCVAVFTEHKAEITHLEFSPDGEFLASADKLGIVHIRRLSSLIGH